MLKNDSGLIWPHFKDDTIPTIGLSPLEMYPLSLMSQQVNEVFSAIKFLY